MSGYDWEPDRSEDRERERAWEQADRDEHAEMVARDRLTRDVGEMTERGETARSESMQAPVLVAPKSLPRSVISPTMHEKEAEA